MDRAIRTHLFPDSFGQLFSLGAGGVRKHQDEFLASISSKNIVGPYRLFDQTCQIFQHLVSCEMAETVVHFLEMIDIKEHTAQVATFSPGTLEFFLESGQGVATIKNAG